MCMAQFLTNRNRGCITEIVSERIQPMQYEGLITFLLLQLCRHNLPPLFLRDSTSNLVEWNKNVYSTIFNVLNRNKSCIAEIEVVQQKTCRITHTYEYSVPQKKDDSIIYCLIDIQTIIKLWKKKLTMIIKITIVIK